MKHSGILTLDTEDWYHANFSQLSQRQNETQQLIQNSSYNILRNIDLWIQLLDQYQAKSTCFVLGEFAQKYPDAIQRLSQQGHEIASHGHTHDLVYEMSQLQFRDFLKKSLTTLESITGTKVKGFRAPSWSVNLQQQPWFFDELLLQGIEYDSSTFPLKTGLFGDSNIPTQLQQASDHQSITRIFAPVLSLFGKRIPYSSGAFFRLFPKVFLNTALRHTLNTQQTPMMILHPRELDPHHPRLPLHGFENFIHYYNLSSTQKKLEHLLQLKNWEWVTIQTYLKSAKHTTMNFIRRT